MIDQPGEAASVSSLVHCWILAASLGLLEISAAPSVASLVADER